MEVKRIIVGALETNCYLLADGREMALIDPGGNFTKIGQAVEEMKKAQTADLKYIILTHYHSDHTGSVTEVKSQFGGQILISEAEKNYLDFKIDKFLADKEDIKIGDCQLKVSYTPGHSAGSICLIGENLIFTGDTLFASGYGRTDLEGGSEEEMKKSLARLRQIIKPGMTVYPGHGEIFIS